MGGFGIGFGAFAQGLLGGLKAGDSLVDSVNKTRAQMATKGAIDSARKDYDGAVADDVLTQAGQQPGIGQPFDAAAATTKAKQKIGSFTDFLYNTKMPELIDSRVQAGDLEGADKLRKWGQDGKERKFMEGFGKVLAAGVAGKSSGDYTDFGDQSMNLVNSGNYGMKINGYDLVKDGDGKTTGITYKITGDDGKETSHTFNSMDEANQFIAGNANPVARYKQWSAETDAATKLKAETAKEKMKAVIGIGKDTAVENVKQQNRLSLDDHKTGNEMWKESAKTGTQKVQQQRAAEYKTQALRDAGYSDDRIKELLPAILGVSDTRKGASPQERVRMMRNTLMQGDFEFARKSPDEQNEIIRKVMRSDDDIAAEFSKQGDTTTPAQKKPLNVFQ